MGVGKLLPQRELDPLHRALGLHGFRLIRSIAQSGRTTEGGGQLIHEQRAHEWMALTGAATWGWSEQFVQGVKEVVRQLVRQGALAPALESDLCCPYDILLEDRIQPLRQRCVADR